MPCPAPHERRGHELPRGGVRDLEQRARSYAPTMGKLPNGHSTSPTSASTSGDTPTLAASRVAFRASSQMNVLLQSHPSASRAMAFTASSMSGWPSRAPSVSPTRTRTDATWASSSAWVFELASASLARKRSMRLRSNACAMKTDAAKSSRSRRRGRPPPAILHDRECGHAGADHRRRRDTCGQRPGMSAPATGQRGPIVSVGYAFAETTSDTAPLRDEAEDTTGTATARTRGRCGGHDPGARRQDLERRSRAAARARAR
jgi:hypothetical protein